MIIFSYQHARSKQRHRVFIRKGRARDPTATDVSASHYTFRYIYSIFKHDYITRTQKSSEQNIAKIGYRFEIAGTTFVT